MVIIIFFGDGGYCPMIDRCDDQGGGVLAAIVETRFEYWVERLSEGAASSRVEMNHRPHLIEGQPPPPPPLEGGPPLGPFPPPPPSGASL